MLSKHMVRASTLVLIMVLAVLSPLLNPATVNGFTEAQLDDSLQIYHTNSNSELHLGFDWASQGGGNGHDSINDIEIQDDGSYIIAGTFSGSATFGSTQLNSLGGKDIYVAKMDEAGNWLWAISAGTTGDDEAVGVGLGENESIRVAGVYCDIGSCSWNGSAYPSATFGNHILTGQSPNGNAFVAAVNNLEIGIGLGKFTLILLARRSMLQSTRVVFHM